MAKGPKTSGSGGATYYEINDFRLGMDLRKDPMTAPAGTLRLLQNAHITPGGEIEKRSEFAFWCNAPAGTLGLCSANAKVYAFINNPGGSGAVVEPPPDGSAPGVIYIPSPHSTVDLTNGGKISPVISDGSGGTTLVKGYKLTLLPIDPTDPNPYYGLNLPLTNGMPLIGTDVLPGSDVMSTIDNFHYNVNASEAQISFPSTAVGPAIPGVTMTKLLDWDTYDGQVYAIFQGSDGVSYHYYNGQPVPQANGKGNNCRTYKTKMFAVGGRNLYFSAATDPNFWVNPGADNHGTVTVNGSGVVNVGANDSDSENLVSMEVYYDKMALFSNLSCQLWFLDPDPSLDQYMQTLRDAGTLAANSVRQYVAQDVYFLGQHGIRSLRARDLTMTAAVADVGSPLDPLIQMLIADSPAGVIPNVQTILSPRTGRIWMCFGDAIYVLSSFASPNISAWSVYIPEFDVAPMGLVYADPYVVMLSTDQKIYRFGSKGDLTYDSCPVEVLSPFLNFEKSASFKFYQGYDAVCYSLHSEGWKIEMSFDPTASPPPYDTICLLDTPTMMDGRIPISGRSTHVQIRATHQAPGPATFAKMIIHYATAETD